MDAWTVASALSQLACPGARRAQAAAYLHGYLEECGDPAELRHIALILLACRG